MKDIVGNEYLVGDTVATDTMAYKSSSLRVGTVVEATDKQVKVQYTLETWRGKATKRSVWRYHNGVVKVAANA